MTTLSTQTYILPGARLGDENPLPYFRDPAKDRVVETVEPFPEEKRAYLGWETAFRVLPYRMQDQYTREREQISFQAVVLENEILKATFLPEVGGRLVSLIHKPLDRELLHRNPVFQPANLAIRNAWFSGGIEWNIGQFGHTFHTCSPLFAAEIKGAQGEPGLRLYEFERCKRLFWHIDFYLPPGFPFLVAYTRVVNPNDEPVSMYWWTNIAVNETPDVRVLAPTSNALYLATRNDTHGFGEAELPRLPSLNGADGTYSRNTNFANEFFFQCDEAEMPWEAALDERGSGLIELSTRRLKYRKLFCWGMHPGGRRWQEFLSQPGEAYLEIQAGLAPTQLHGLPMPAHAAWDWTEAFGYLEADPALVHGEDWQAAWGCVDSALKAKLDPQKLDQIEADCRELALSPSPVILHHGSGWGALEMRRAGRSPGERLPEGAWLFPESTLGPEQAKWLALLEEGSLPEHSPDDLPGEWMTQPEWEALLSESLQTDQGRSWFALLHLGVMRLERLDEAGAAAAWEESLQLRPSVWAYRNLAVLRKRQGDLQQAIDIYAQGWELLQKIGGSPAFATARSAYVVEYLQTLVEAKQFERGMQLYLSLPTGEQAIERVQLLRGQCAIELNDLETVEQVLQQQFAVVREGETILTDLWFELQARRESARTGRPLDDELRREVRLTCPPPAQIDLRSIEA
ncbi:MAG: DUF5107 domain-containing protein [Chloroflexi bacterium]|nr:DUF5107 domain-containing protein [Chloroflexota bacterium]